MSAREMRQPLNLLWTAYYSKFKILFYTFTKALGQRFDIFSSPDPDLLFPKIIVAPQKEFLPQEFSYLLLLMCPCEYIVIHANVWAAYHIPQFISYILKSCLPLVS